MSAPTPLPPVPLARVEAALDRVIRLVAIAAGLAIVAMMLQVAVDVALRYATGSGLPGTLTIVSYYYMVIVAFVPLGFAELRRAHIQMDLVTNLMPRRGALWVTGWGLVPTGLVTGALTVRGVEEALNQMQIGAAQVQGTTSIPTWPAQFALPLGAGLMTALVALRFVQFLVFRVDPATGRRVGQRAGRKADRATDTGA